MSSDTGKTNSSYAQHRPGLIRKFRNGHLYSKIFFSGTANRIYPLFSKNARLLWLNIEFTSLCNLRCKMCSIDHDIKGGFLEIDILRKALEEIVSSKLLKVKNIALWYGGETLLHPKFHELLELIAEYRKKKKLFPYVSLLTNGVLLKEKKLESILQTGAADSVLISVDGGSKESFEYLRKGASWETVINNVNLLIEEIKTRQLPIETGLVSIIEKEETLSGEFKELLSKVDNYLPRTFHTWDGSSPIEFPIENKPFKKSLCYTVTRQMALHWNGNVSPCCMDLNQKGTIGNIKENTLYEIYHSPLRKKIIEEMQKHKRQNIDFCRYCSN